MLHALRRISVVRRATSSVARYPKIGNISAPQAMAVGLAIAATHATPILHATIMVHATTMVHSPAILHAIVAVMVMVVVHMLPALRVTRVAEHPHAVAQMQEARRAIAHHAVSLRRSGRTM
jgi:hypothetical protein